MRVAPRFASEPSPVQQPQRRVVMPPVTRAASAPPQFQDSGEDHIVHRIVSTSPIVSGLLMRTAVFVHCLQ